MGNYSSFKRKRLKWRFFEQIQASARLLGYAYTAQIKGKGDFGMKERALRRDFPRKKIWEDIGLEARDFSEKIFFGIRKYKIVSDLSCASRRLPLGGSPTPYPAKRQICRK